MTDTERLVPILSSRCIHSGYRLSKQVIANMRRFGLDPHDQHTVRAYMDEERRAEEEGYV